MPLVRTDDFDCWYFDDCFVEPWARPDVVLIQHGCLRTAEYWRSWVPDLAAEHRVLRRDMRAHGRSSAGGDNHEWTPESLAQDVTAFLDELDLESVHYIGESLGGVTGIVLAALHPARVKTLTLVQSPIRIDQRMHDLWRGEYPTWSAALRSKGLGEYAMGDSDPNDPEARWQRQERESIDAEALYQLADALTLRREPLSVEPFLPNISAPTLVLAPSDSPYTSLSDQLSIRFAVPNAEIEIFEGGGHDIYLSQARRCTARVAEFIARSRQTV
jgi:pimeloyl-ACP methyl ester carboxylesterase